MVPGHLSHFPMAEPELEFRHANAPVLDAKWNRSHDPAIDVDVAVDGFGDTFDFAAWQNIVVQLESGMNFPPTCRASNADATDHVGESEEFFVSQTATQDLAPSLDAPRGFGEQVPKIGIGDVKA